MAWYSYLAKPFVWTYRQSVATYQNYRDLVGSFALQDALPNGVESLINELINLVPAAIGTQGAKRQVYASMTLAVLILLSLPFSAGTSIVLMVFPLATFFVGLLRMTPWINSLASEGLQETGATKDRNVPLWRRE